MYVTYYILGSESIKELSPIYLKFLRYQTQDVKMSRCVRFRDLFLNKDRIIICKCFIVFCNDLFSSL